MKPAILDWQNQTPRSTQFDDIYFSPENGMAESQYVFLQANHLPDRWQQDPKLTFCELGFGTGLNFLLTWQQWQKTAPPNSHLHYIAIEKFPLDKAILARVYAQWSTLMSYTDRLHALYPPIIEGFHQQSITDNLTLTLIFNEVQPALTQITDKIDIWYLDGFAPQKNPEMWTQAVFNHMHRLSRPNTTFSTFTAAGQVRRDLQSAGFIVDKQKGFGQKREMLTGRYAAPHPTAKKDRHKAEIKPWFRRPKTQRLNAPSVAIIGAGLAGCACANQLAQQGYQVTLIDQHPTVAQAASGNPQGILKPYITLDNSPLDQFNTTGFQHSLHKITEFIQQQRDLSANLCGAIELHDTDWLTKLNARHLPEELAQILNPEQCQTVSGIALNQSGLYLPTALALDPTLFCQALIDQQSIDIAHQHKISHFEHNQQQWLLHSETGVSLRAGYIVLCTGHQSATFPQTEAYPILPRPGQISVIPTCQALQNLQRILYTKGYCLPATDGKHLIGATHRPNLTTEVSQADHQYNLNQLETVLPDIAHQITPDTFTGRVSFRANTPDHLPLVGPIADIQTVHQHYAKLTDGGTLSRCHYPAATYLPGLYFCTGFGSRGLASCVLSAKIIGALLTGTTLPVSRSLYEALHPSRFWIRALTRSSKA